MCWFHTDRQLSSTILLCHYRSWVEIRSMIFSRILGSRASTRIVVASEDKCFPSKKHTYECAHTQTAFFPFFCFYCWLWHYTIWNIPLTSLSYLSWQFPLLWEWGMETAVMLCQHISAIAKTLMQCKKSII